MRVLIVNVTLASRTGTQTALRDLALGLARTGHRPMVYSPAALSRILRYVAVDYNCVEPVIHQQFVTRVCDDESGSVRFRRVGHLLASFASVTRAS